MTEPERPSLSVVRGDPTEEELAAVVAVLAVAAARGKPPAATAARGQWRARGRNVRPALAHGPGAWYSSGLPR